MTFPFGIITMVSQLQTLSSRQIYLSQLEIESHLNLDCHIDMVLEIDMMCEAFDFDLGML